MTVSRSLAYFLPLTHSPPLPLTHSPACCSAQTPTAIASFWVGAIIVVCSIFLYAWAGNYAKNKASGKKSEIVPSAADDVESNRDANEIEPLAAKH